MSVQRGPFSTLVRLKHLDCDLITYEFFPRASWLNVCGSDCGDPFPQSYGDELRASSERMCAGTPRTMHRSQGPSITSVAFSFRATRNETELQADSFTK